MKRRSLLLAPFGLLASRITLAADQPWSTTLLGGGFVGEAWQAGLQIDLAPHWKTYWRVPGDGGVAPSLEVTGSNLKSVRFDYPLPHRFTAETGTTIGYKERVVFPFFVTPVDAMQPLALTFKAFFGVCDEVCIPARFETAFGFDPAAANPRDQATLNEWALQVPKVVQQGPVTRASSAGAGGKVTLRLELNAPVKDIFVEGNPLHYFAAPRFSDNVAVLNVSGAKSHEELKAVPLRITLDGASGPLEQVVTVG